MKNALFGVFYTLAGSGHILSHSQFSRCNEAVMNNGTTVSAQNLLLFDCEKVLSAAGATYKAEHLTVDTADELLHAYSSSTYAFTNCLFTAVTMSNWWPSATVYANFNGTNADPAAVFRTVGWGNHYLISDSPFFSAGTTNITPQLLKSLQSRTVGAPVVISRSAFPNTWWQTNDVRLLPHASRGFSLTPTIGYYYDPIDYIIAEYDYLHPLTGANITIVSGTVIGTADPFYSGSGTKIRANGSAEAPIVFGRASAVQEGEVGWRSDQFVLDVTTAPTPDVSLNFTHWSVAENGSSHLAVSGTNAMTLTVSNSEFNNGCIKAGDGYNWIGLKVTNSLFERCTLYMVNTQQIVQLQNCSFFAGTINFNLGGANANANVAITNTFFDGTILNTVSTSICHNFNGYYNTAYRLPTGGGGGANDVLLSNNMTYATGTFGRYYQSLTNFVNRGNTSATNLGLYHFTSCSPEVQEGSSIVDIGYHYAGADPGPDGLVGYWRMDEGIGGYTADSSIYGNNGTLASGANWSTGTVGPGAGAFDGVDDYVQVGAPSTLTLSKAVTMSAWIYPTGTNGMIVNKEGEYEMAIYDQQFMVAIAYPGATWDWIMVTNKVATNQWTHVAATYDSSAGLRLYIGGTMVRSYAATGTIGDFDAPENDFRIGNRQLSGSPFPFKGYIDDVRVYNRVLSGSEIAVLAAKSTWDTDGDGIPDYLEDANGNGTLDSGESDRNSAMDAGFSVLITEPDARFNLP